MSAAAITSLDDLFLGHGGRLYVARSLYPRAPQPWIDLSTGINPKPYPAPRASVSARARLPELGELRALEEAAARAFGVEDAARVVAVGGSEAALRLMPYVLRATQAVVVGPTYSSHRDAWEKAGVPLTYTTNVEHASPLPVLPRDSLPVTGEGQGEGFLKRQSRSAPPSPDASRRPLPEPGEVKRGAVLTLVNPNNPDGAVTPRDHLLNLHDKLHARDSHLLLDEAFADTDPTHSVADLAGTDRYSHLLVLRSFGKFYGLAGVRLGFVIAAPAIAQRLRHLLGDWPVSADAIVAGRAAYADAAWVKRTRERLRSAAASLDTLLVRGGFTIVGGTSLFRLVRSDDARRRCEQLLRAGILVRPFDHDCTLLRFGLPFGAGAWQRLTRVLETPV